MDFHYGHVALITTLLVALRIYFLLPRPMATTKKPRRTRADTCALAIFLGSGVYTR